MQVMENIEYYIFHSCFSPLLYRSLVSFLHYLLYLERIPLSNIFIDLHVHLLNFIRALYLCYFAAFTIYRFVIKYKIRTVKSICDNPISLMFL